MKVITRFTRKPPHDVHAINNALESLKDALAEIPSKNGPERGGNSSQERVIQS